MIYLEECTDRCYAEEGGGCTALIGDGICGNACPFYKPRGCKDWIRIKRNGKAVLMAPEEYERSFGSEEDRKRRALYWRIKNHPASDGRF